MKKTPTVKYGQLLRDQLQGRHALQASTMSPIDAVDGSSTGT